MLVALIVIGRFVICLAAILVVVVAAVAGWNLPYPTVSYGIAPFEPVRIATAIGGLLAGLVSAGSVLGLAAAIFDIQRRLAAAVPVIHNRDGVGRPVEDWRR